MKLDWSKLPKSHISRESLVEQGYGPIPASQKVIVIEGMVYYICSGCQTCSTSAS